MTQERPEPTLQEVKEAIDHEKMLIVTKLLRDVYGPLIDNEALDFEKVFESITDEVRHYLLYETMDKE
tara:strand:+ start:497 stop:700 length:204 start_codon:yes stop_codon:yes gene_type:complete